MSFSGTIQSGKLLLDHKPDFQAHLQTLEGKRVKVSVEKYRRKRTLDQSAYYWLILGYIAKETGQDPQSLHEAFKYRFSSKVTIKGLVIPQSTTRKDTLEFTEYIENVRQFAREFLNINTPDPNGTGADYITTHS
jgi:hypothetical protein